MNFKKCKIINQKNILKNLSSAWFLVVITYQFISCALVTQFNF